MASRISRRQLARFIARKITDEPENRNEWLKMAAAYLVEHRQSDRVDHLVLDIAREIQRIDGTVLATVVSAHELTEQVRRDIEAYLQAAVSARKVVLDVSVDASLLSGVVVKTPDYELNTSAQHRLRQLKSLEV